MTIAAWPVVDGRRVVHAYKPGEDPSAESPLRTLKRRRWASGGVRVTRRARGLLSGQTVVFSSLNVDSARLARHGEHEAAARVARVAADLEAGPEFTQLQRVLSSLSGGDAQQVLDGVLPKGAPDALVAALRAVARRTERLRVSELKLPASAEVTVGRVAEVHEGFVILAVMAGPSTAVPRWMAGAARRDEVGALLALVTDKLDGRSAVVEAVPAIDVDGEGESGAFSPFGRGDARVLAITEADVGLLAGSPAPLRVLVPVTIEG